MNATTRAILIAALVVAAVNHGSKVFPVIGKVFGSTK